MITKSYWQLTLMFAIATSAMSAYLFPMFPTTSYADTSGYGSPVFAFEMATSVEDLENVFGLEADPLRVERVNEMDRGNYWDFGFMFLYALFLSLFSLAAFKDSEHWLWLLSAAIGFASGCFDAIENVILLKLTNQFYPPQLLDMLWVPAYAKFSAIALSSLGAAYYIFSRETKVVWKALSVAAILGGLSIFIGLASPSEYGWVLRHSITLSWVSMLLYAAVRSIK